MTNDAHKQFTITPNTPGALIELTFGDIAESIRIWKVASVDPSFVVLEREGQVMKIQTIRKYEDIETRNFEVTS